MSCFDHSKRSLYQKKKMNLPSMKTTIVNLKNHYFQELHEERKRKVEALIMKKHYFSWSSEEKRRCQFHILQRNDPTFFQPIPSDQKTIDTKSTRSKKMMSKKEKEKIQTHKSKSCNRLQTQNREPILIVLVTRLLQSNEEIN